MPLSRIARTLGLTIALCATIVRVAHAGGTNDAKLAGLRHYAAGQFQEAIPYFDQVLAQHKRDLEILIKRGVCYLRVDRPLDALEDFDRVNQYSGWGARVFGANTGLTPLSTWIVPPAPDVSFAENWGNRGIALLMVGRDEEALESFRTSIALWEQPQNRGGAMGGQGRGQIVRGRAGAYEGLGQSYHRLGQDEQAYAAYSQAVVIDPTDPNGHAGRAEILTALKLFDAADTDYSEAIRLDPSHSRAHCGRGIIRTELGRDDLALADFNQAIAADPSFARAYSYRGGLYARRGQNDRRSQTTMRSFACCQGTSERARTAADYSCG